MEFEARIDIQLTEAAAAVARRQSFQVPPQIQPWLLSVQPPDIVHLPPCTSTFVVLFRQWTVSDSQLKLTVFLGLPDEPPRLQAM